MSFNKGLQSGGGLKCVSMLDTITKIGSIDIVKQIFKNEKETELISQLINIDINFCCCLFH